MTNERIDQVPSSEATPQFQEPTGTESTRIELTLGALLLERMKKGEAEAWRVFLVAYHDVFGRATRAALWKHGAHTSNARLGSPDDLIDQAKSYFYRAFLRTFRAYESEARFRAYLFRTVENCVLESLRKTWHHSLRTIESAAESEIPKVPEELSTADCEIEELLKCVERLPAHYRVVVAMKLNRPDEPSRSLGELLGISLEAVHKRYQRALDLLRECLERRGRSSHGR